jgi:hypothetical protein
VPDEFHFLISFLPRSGIAAKKEEPVVDIEIEWKA